MDFKRRKLIKMGLALIAVLAVTAALPDTAEARKHKHCQRKVAHHCGRCHAPVYVEHRFVGYDHCGHPVYQWVEVPHYCGHHGHGYGAHHYSRDPVAEVITGILRGLAR